MSAVENIALTAGYQTGVGGRIHWREEVSRTREALAGLGLSNVDVKAPVDALPPAQRTAVAIARALVGWEDGATLLVLDEPTATLPGDDVKRLFEVIHRLKERGVSILYVSHHLDEVFELADRVTVLRDGERVTTVPVARPRPHGSRRADRRAPHRDHERHRDHRAQRRGAAHGPRLAAAAPCTASTSTSRAGEIVGLAGITGSGREHVLGLIAGQIPRDDGDVSLDGTPIANYQPKQAIDAGVAFVPAERAVRGTVGPMNVRENLSISDVATPLPRRPPAPQGRDRRDQGLDRSAVDQDLRHRGADRLAEWRQPAEGDVRQGAAPRTEAAPARRADAGHRRRRQGADPQARRRGRRDRESPRSSPRPTPTSSCGCAIAS